MHLYTQLKSREMTSKVSCVSVIHPLIIVFFLETESDKENKDEGGNMEVDIGQ